MATASKHSFLHVCSGFLKTQQQLYLIEPLARCDDGEHAVFRWEQLKVSGTPSCGATLGPSHHSDRAPQLANLFRSRSWVSVGSLRGVCVLWKRLEEVSQQA